MRVFAVNIHISPTSGEICTSCHQCLEVDLLLIKKLFFLATLKNEQALLSLEVRIVANLQAC